MDGSPLTALALQQGEQRALFSGVEDRVLGGLGGPGLRLRTGDPRSSTAAAYRGAARCFGEQPGRSACSGGHASYPTLAGKVGVSFEIDMNGDVSAVGIEENTTGSDDLAACIKSAVRKFRINPPPPHDIEVAGYPYLLSPGQRHRTDPAVEGGP